MPTPLEICLEDLSRPDEERYLRCVAVEGGEPGLALDDDGVVRWRPENPAACGLWISADDRLVLMRSHGAAPVAVSRAGRSVDAPEGKPVLLLHGDVLSVGARQLRVHVHGPASEVHRPEPLRGALLATVRAAAAALALGAVVGPGVEATATAAPIEVRQNPPGATPARQVLCTVTGWQKPKTGPLTIEGSCPANTRIGVGHVGQLLDDKGGAVKDGSVTVTKVQGLTFVAKTKLSSQTSAPRVQFYVHW